MGLNSYLVEGGGFIPNKVNGSGSPESLKDLVRQQTAGDAINAIDYNNFPISSGSGSKQAIRGFNSKNSTRMAGTLPVTEDT